MTLLNILDVFTINNYTNLKNIIYSYYIIVYIMNKIGYFLTLLFTVIVHILLRRFNQMQDEQKNIIEQYKNKLGLNPKIINKEATMIEKQQKFIDFKDYDYKGPNYSLIEDDEGYDIDNDYDAFKEDLMKYVEGANDYFKNEKRAEPVMTEKRVIGMNHNAISQPMDKKEPSFKPSKAAASMDKQFNAIFESNNQKRNSALDYKTLKPDQWTYNNEKTINGGFFDEKAGLMPYDASEESNYVLL